MTQATEQHNPIDTFSQWYEEALKLNVNEPCSFSLATTDTSGQPSVRIVLLRKYSKKGFYFFTNLESKKGQQLSTTPKAAMCFYWDELNRQVRIEGTVKQVEDKEADEYFANRPRGSQLGAWASKQSSTLHHPSDLKQKLEQVTDEFSNQEVPRPPFWSGYKIIPNLIEFWEKGEFRLHTRTVFTKTESGWEKELLYP